MPVELDEALQQISEIRGRLASVETFREYRALSVAATGLAAVFTGIVQSVWLPKPESDPPRWVLLWVGGALLCLMGAGAEILHGYWKCQSPHRRATTRIVLSHLVPPITAGGVLAWALSMRGADSAGLLPGLWAVLVSLGIFASRRHLPRAIGWVALYYLAAGSAILFLLPGTAALAPWVMAATFGLGQLAAALVLYWNLERDASQE